LEVSLTVMSQLKLVAADRLDVPPLMISARLRSQLVYFMTPPDAPDVPRMGENEYWISQSDAARWLSDGVFQLVSPLDTENMTEVELSEEQEAFLNWLAKHAIQHIRAVE
jgi:hypothetical protein